MRILYLDIDALRADHLGCYGYHRDTSPNIDRVAAEGVRFNNCYVTDAPCLPSRTALMTGQFGIHTGVVNHGGTAADLRLQGESRGFMDNLRFHSLPGYLNSTCGLHTCYIGGFGQRHTTWSFYAGFREIHDTGMCGMESAEDVSPAVLDWIERRGGGDDWFLYLNYWDPHTPVRVPAAFGNPFANDPLPAHFDQALIDGHMKRPGPHTILDIGMYDDNTLPEYPRHPGKVTDMDEMRQLIDGYDCGIRYADEHIGKLLDALDRQGVLDELVIIISADHGENYGELGIYAEHGTADHACCRIPMIIRWPGKAKAGYTDDGLHYHLDLGPTLAELTHNEPRQEWDGRSYAASVTAAADTGRDYLVLGQCAHGCQRAVRWDDWIYIRSWHDGYHCWDDELLFNLKDDPYEQQNVRDQHPDVVETARRYYDEWHNEMLASMPYGYREDPLQTALREAPYHCATDLAAYCKRLEATGRGEWGAVIRERHPKMFATRDDA